MISLADAIIQEDTNQVLHLLQRGYDPNQLDEYGFTPLIEAAIADNFEIAEHLIKSGADPNLPDATGGTALHWAAENNNVKLSERLLKAGANPNAYTLAGQPVLVMPLLRQQHTLKRLLQRQGASIDFAQDYINAKLLGHMFELVGTASIVDLDNKFVEIDFEGFYLEFSLAVIADSLAQFKNHFAARKLRRFNDLIQTTIQVIQRAAQLNKYQQYRTDRKAYAKEISHLLQQSPLLIPVGYEGHAITFIKWADILIKCDRREDSRLYDNIMIYRIHQPQHFTQELAYNLLYEKQDSEFINEALPNLLKLQPITELKVEAQISGNCSWANVEACIPALLFLLITATDGKEDVAAHKNLALHIFHQWRDWNKYRSLQFCIQSFQQADTLRKACKAEILAAILFQRCHYANPQHRVTIETILPVLTTPNYKYLLDNYLKSYAYQSLGEEGKNFLQLLKRYGVLQK